MDRGTGTIPWSTVVTQIKNYAKANDNIAQVRVGRVHRHLQARRTGPTPRTATAASPPPRARTPRPRPASIGNNINYLRVRLPASTVKSFFAKAIGNGDLTVGATSTAKVVYTVTASQTTTLAAGGPCALCILSPTGLTLDGQNGDVTITDGNVIVNSTSGTAASLNPNGHVKITTVGGSIGGPGSCAPGAVQQLLGRRLLAHVDETGRGHRPPRQRAPVRERFARHHELLPDDEPDRRHNSSTLLPGIYSTIKNSHTLSPGIYVIKGGITLNGNDLIQGDGVMLYFACSNYPSPVRRRRQDRRRHQGDRQRRAAHHRDPPVAVHDRPRACVRTSGMMSFADRNNTRDPDLAGKRHQRERVRPAASPAPST